MTRILTSGGAPSAFEGRAMLAEMVRAVGGQLEVQAGAGITPENVRAIVATGVAGVHFSAKMAVPGAAARGT